MRIFGFQFFFSGLVSYKIKKVLNKNYVPSRNNNSTLLIVNVNSGKTNECSLDCSGVDKFVHHVMDFMLVNITKEGFTNVVKKGLAILKIIVITS